MPRNRLLGLKTVLAALAVTTSVSSLNAQIRMNDSRNWLTKQDIQEFGVSNGRPTKLDIKMEVSEAGIVELCEAQLTPTDVDLGKRLCARAMERARYVPAEDVSGVPIKTKDEVSYLIRSGSIKPTRDFGGAEMVEGQIFDEDYPLIAMLAGEQGDVGMTFEIDEAGNAVNCRVLLSSNSRALDRKSCAMVTQRFKFRPPIGKRGLRSATTARFQIQWRR